MLSSFRNLIESGQADCLPVGLLIVDPLGEIKALNKIGADLLSLTPTQYLKVHCTSLGDGEHFLVTLIDISEQKNLELQLINTQKLQSLGELAAGVAHDFNNLLGGIRGGIDVIERSIRKSVVDVEVGRRIDLVKKCVAQASDLSRQLLNFARRRKADTSSFRLADLVEETIAIIEKTTAKTITFHSQIAHDLFNVVGDMGQVSSVLMNLGINAVDAIVNVGEVRFVAQNVQLNTLQASRLNCAAGWYVKLEVSDTGTGIAPEHLNRIFEAFYTTKAASSGTGLGLSLAHKIVASHGGHIGVRSKVGEGSCFEVYLPSDQLTVQAQPPSTVGKQPSQDRPLTGNRILLVDDDELLLQVTQQLLEHLGAEVVVAHGGKEALAVFGAAGDFDLAILDMMMPELDGIATFKQLRESGAQVPVLFYSGHSFPEEINQIAKNDKIAILAKPFEVTDLTTKIRTLIA